MGCDRRGIGCNGGKIVMEQRMGREIAVESAAAVAADGEDLGSVVGWRRPRLRFSAWRRQRGAWRRKKTMTSRVSVDCRGGGRWGLHRLLLRPVAADGGRPQHRRWLGKTSPWFSARWRRWSAPRRRQNGTTMRGGASRVLRG
uniref:Uncharacterized protein n=1 Tax=Oryza glumipatula TaxID=40148 RepID=A0A0E0B6F4_9ORYZ